MLAAGGPRGLDVLPFPGTPDAAPTTQITFPALTPAQIRSITVSGSRTGRHPGDLTALPDGRGTTFVPSSPFKAGERVSVKAVLASRAAGTASLDHNSTRLSFSFTIARTVTTGDGAGAKKTVTTFPGTQTFRSAPYLHPPKVTATSDPDTTSGDLLLTPNNGPQNGPLILNGKGQVVWFDPITNGEEALDLQVQSYEGQPVLTWWQGYSGNGYGTDSEDVIVNSSYKTIAVVHAGDGYSADLHEFQITPQGTALLTAFVPVKANLTSLGGTRNETVLDCVIQEVDISTGQVLWEWHALGHVPVSASYAGKPTASSPYDYFHINSIQELPNGNLLISSRSTWAVYEISRTTGKIIWQLGGKHSSFKLGAGANFEWQHDARLAPNNTLTLFDDADTPKEESQSRAVELQLNMKTMKATLVQSYVHDPPLLAASQGNAQTLANGNVFVGWGAQPEFSEYTPNGQQIFNGSFTAPIGSYRAFRSPWTGQPDIPPSISISAGRAGAVTVFASWNGATDVARWQLLAGPDAKDLRSIASAASAGFETSISGRTAQRYVAVRALSSAGKTLGTSWPVLR
ncbi:MAG TPA: arylsulfotransferase family protein [Solirubrobacteraceae bacterium]|nr:arylsulfotransferase family protein [Solirubrobacteraceae bacterium]